MPVFSGKNDRTLDSPAFQHSFCRAIIALFRGFRADNRTWSYVDSYQNGRKNVLSSCLYVSQGGGIALPVYFIGNSLIETSSFRVFGSDHTQLPVIPNFVCRIHCIRVFNDFLKNCLVSIAIARPTSARLTFRVFCAITVKILTR